MTERVPGVVAPWARWTRRLAHWLAAIAVALGGMAGARLSQQLGVARSRSTLAGGARQGAPEATQAADRFHLLQNLVEALEQIFHTHRMALEAVNETLCRQGVPLADDTVAVAVPPPPPTSQEKTAQRRARRVECQQQVWALRAQGWPGHVIATHLGIGKSTVFRSLRTTSLPERKRRSDRGRSVLNPYKPYVLERWNAGCRNALRLYGALQRRGYPGSYAADRISKVVEK